MKKNLQPLLHIFSRKEHELSRYKLLRQRRVFRKISWAMLPVSRFSLQQLINSTKLKKSMRIDESDGKLIEEIAKTTNVLNCLIQSQRMTKIVYGIDLWERVPSPVFPPPHFHVDLHRQIVHVFVLPSSYWASNCFDLQDQLLISSMVLAMHSFKIPILDDGSGLLSFLNIA